MRQTSRGLLREERLFQVVAVILIILLPVTARLSAAPEYSWSLIDPNLVQVRSGPGSVNFEPNGMAMVANRTDNESRITAVTASSTTRLLVDASFASSSLEGQFMLQVSNAYDSRSAILTFDAATGGVSIQTTDEKGALISTSTLGPFSPARSFEVSLAFSPGSPLAFQVNQSGTAERANVSYPELSSTVPVNFELILKSPGGPSVVQITVLDAALPGNERQYSAQGALLYAQLALTLAAGVLGFRTQVTRLLKSRPGGLPGVLGRLSGFISSMRPVLFVLLLAVPVQAWVMSLGTHRYDVYTMELWGYVSVKYGPSNVYPFSLVVPGGKPVGWDSAIGSPYPYPPLSLYVFSAVGYVGRAIDPSFAVPSQTLEILTKTCWLILLNLTGLVLSNELRKRGVSTPGVVVAYLLVGLNPGMLMESVIWGQFGIMVALFVLLSIISALRDKWTAAFFFILLAVLSKQGALLIAAVVIPAILAKAGLRKGVWHLALALVPTFFVLLPLFLLGISPSYVVDVSAGSVAFNALSPSPVSIASWQTVVSIGDFNIWPLVTAIFNGQQGIGRFRFPDSLPGQAFGMPYVRVGVVLAAAGIIVMLLKILHSRKNGLLGDEVVFLTILGFLWVFEVLTRLAGRYLVYMVPLALLTWVSPRTSRAGTVLAGLLSLDLALTMLAGLGIEAADVPAEFPGFAQFEVIATNDVLITLVATIQLLTIVFLAYLALKASLRSEIPLAKSYVERLKSASLPPHPLVSVIILSFNGSAYTMKCVDSVLASSYPNCEVIVADNASTDDTVERLRPLISEGRILLVRNEENLRYGMGNNAGALSAKGDLLFFVNNDTELEPETITEMVTAFQQDPWMGAAQPMIMELSHRDRISSAGQVMDRLGFHEVLTQRPQVQATANCTTSYASGAALMVRRDLFSAVGGFDSLYWFYHEDSDLSWKVWLSGHRVAVVPSSVMYHAEGGTTSAWRIRQRLFQVVRGQLIMVAKNYEGARALYSTAMLATIYAGLGVAYAVRGRPSFAGAVFKGIGSFVLSLDVVARRREQINRIRCRPDNALDSEVLVPFDPLAIFQHKRAGWGYIGDYETTAL